jgi:hypothetical protein
LSWVPARDGTGQPQQRGWAGEDADRVGRYLISLFTVVCQLLGLAVTAPCSPPFPASTARSNAPTRIDAEEFYRQLKGVVIDDTLLFNDKLQE